MNYGEGLAPASFEDQVCSTCQHPPALTALWRSEIQC
jgi:hypothetical protein